MANEIMVLNRATQGVDTLDESFSFLFFFFLNPVITIDGGAFTIVPTPSPGLPQTVLDAALLGPTELLALDTGAAAFVPAGPFVKLRTETSGAFLARIQVLYLTRVDNEIQRLRDLWSRYGLRLDAE